MNRHLRLAAAAVLMGLAGGLAELATAVRPPAPARRSRRARVLKMAEPHR